MISTHLKGKTCKPFVAPTDVVFDEYNVVQPDLLVVCDRSKITEANIQGAPDMVVEILSPSTSRRDRREKKNTTQVHRTRARSESCPVVAVTADASVTKGAGRVQAG